MGKSRPIVLVLITAVVFGVIKFALGFPSAESDVVNITLTISSILFGLFVGFFISELCCVQ